MTNYGLKVTQEGKDITSTDDTDYIYTSKHPIMKTYLFGTSSYTFSSDLSSVDIDITHNLGERKLQWFSIDGSAQNSKWVTGGYWFTFYSSGGNTASRFWINYDLTDRMRIGYREANVSGSGYNPTGESWSFKYYIFIEGID